jgi:ribosomal protein S1
MEEDTLATEEAKQEIKELKDLERKMKLSGTVVNTSLAGALVDIGMEVPGVIHISQLQKEPVNKVEDVLQPGQEVEVWVKRVVPGKQRIELTMIEPLPLEWREISKDMVLKGKVVRLERFGAFVEIGAERPGLVHISEIAHGYIKSPDEVIKEGDEVEVKVLSVNRRRKQIKLSMKALEVDPRDVSKPQPKKSQAVEEEPEVDEPVPTAMEMALRDAMERNKTEAESPSQTTSPKSKQNGEKFDDIMSRTLEQRPNSTS